MLFSFVFAIDIPLGLQTFPRRNSTFTLPIGFALQTPTKTVPVTPVGSTLAEVYQNKPL
jgi:hypothetical protein